MGYQFISDDMMDLLGVATVGAIPPPGSFAWETAELGHLPNPDLATAVEREAWGVVEVLAADYDPSTHEVTGRDYDRNGDGTLIVVAGAVQEVLTLAAIDQAVIDARAAADLAQVIASGLRAVDAAAETARGQFITPGDGQAMSYREKAAEATDCLATYDGANPPPAGAYPLLESEVGITGVDVLAVAAAVDAKRLQWKGIEAQINGTRVTAKNDIEAAADAAAVNAILAGLVWPQP